MHPDPQRYIHHSRASRDPDRHNFALLLAVAVWPKDCCLEQTLTRELAMCVLAATVG